MFAAHLVLLPSPSTLCGALPSRDSSSALRPSPGPSSSGSHTATVTDWVEGPETSNSRLLFFSPHGFLFLSRKWLACISFDLQIVSLHKCSLLWACWASYHLCSTASLLAFLACPSFWEPCISRGKPCISSSGYLGNGTEKEIQGLAC